MKSAVFLVALSLAWSWPLVLSPGSSTISLHFDQFPEIGRASCRERVCQYV